MSTFENNSGARRLQPACDGIKTVLNKKICHPIRSDPDPIPNNRTPPITPPNLGRGV